MQWIPDTIDAITRLYQQAGILGLIGVAASVAVFVLAIAISGILTKHTGEIVGLARAYLTQTQASSLEVIARLDTIAESNAIIAVSNNEIKERVNKLPSDACRIKPNESIVDIIKETFGLSDKEVELVTHRRKEGTPAG